jgi:hypothetical protein
MLSLLVVTMVGLVLNPMAGAKTDKTPWKYIFNGKDFTNWKLVGGTGAAEI